MKIPLQMNQRRLVPKNFPYSRVPSKTVYNLRQKTVKKRVAHVLSNVPVRVVKQRPQIKKTPTAVYVQRYQRKRQHPQQLTTLQKKRVRENYQRVEQIHRSEKRKTIQKHEMVIHASQDFEKQKQNQHLKLFM